MNTVFHSVLAGTALHEPKTHASTHDVSGSDALVSYYVPYTGANAHVDLGAYNLTTTGTISDGVATLSNGNLTGMGNITGTDVDLSLGTGDISTTGSVDIGGTGSGKLYVTDGTRTAEFCDGTYILEGRLPADGYGIYMARTGGGSIVLFDGSSAVAQFYDNTFGAVYMHDSTYALNVNSGLTRLGGAVTLGSTLTGTGLATFGNLDVDTLNLDGNTISDSTGTIELGSHLKSLYQGYFGTRLTLGTTTVTPGYACQLYLYRTGSDAKVLIETATAHNCDMHWRRAGIDYVMRLDGTGWNLQYEGDTVLTVDNTTNTFNFYENPITTSGTLGAGATTVTSLDAGAGAIQTTGVGTFGSTIDGIVLNDGSSAFHVYGTDTTEYGVMDTGLNFNFVAKPTKPVVELIETAGNVDAGLHYYYVEYYTNFGGTAVDYTTVRSSVTTDATHEQVTVTIPVSSDYRVIGRKIYRTQADAVSYYDYLLVDIADNTTTEYIDNISDATMAAAGGRTYQYTQSNQSIDMLLIDEVSSLVLGETGTQMGYGSGFSGNGIVLGALSGANLTAGALGNTLIGFQAGLALTTGTGNVFIGYDPGRSCKNNASNNIGIAQLALYDAQGSNSIGIGYRCGIYAEGSYNVMLGSLAGAGVAGGSNGTYNTLIGNQAGRVLIDGGGHNSFFGNKSGNTVTSASYCIVIGDEINPADNTTDYQLNIGGVIRGLMTSGSEYVRISGADDTNYVQFDGEGNQTFAGSAGFYPRVLNQADEPAAGTGATQCDTGEAVIWTDTDDSACYLCYNHGGTVKTVALT